jgi:hypothetical protein
MKHLAVLVATFMSFSLMAESNLQSCFASFRSKGVPTQFQKCVNKNFAKLKVEGVRSCRNGNFGFVKHSYISCINRNFDVVANQSGVPVTSCYQYQRESLNSTFVRCVNRNFRKL